ncbi:prepilin-type N-terminal cleavage/methylation domain-containing protein [Pseudomonas aeruginosa]|uniref:prepilin-type N-terminal cleavage/methylation domain-containing protein n=1 Tax=Pseudomonas aeruginosa TaxID=287 RepID=UPI000EB07A9D|nr:prepilin-type N-terminal cleavage/methylation domain-containing protein [Pseudomonas aeruginosa]MCO2227976.1 prepilin-type N-terminal cleavage/methylation domain-containing protein [Pseudomonas aeruginosa]MCO2234513.1 prepilin-type N-terminal cleavage/methylation domain-containing protein [Pseudomonas aeruginosa]MCO2238785.1 prepilin-type N-terminal cleavage/methylation domain-containing protein [Pseudomonas aeruginosa]MCO2335264.1 prepilin-type N-terminal cleavage/methylation domain-contain
MPMSVIRPNVDQAAFTLLELLVVLVIVGAIAAVALPGLVKMQETWARRTALDDLFNQLQTLGYRVRGDGRELLIGENGAVPPELLRLPDGWTITARPPIRYMANGVCLGGELQVHQGGTTHTLLLQPPHCAPETVR